MYDPASFDIYMVNPIDENVVNVLFFNIVL